MAGGVYELEPQHALGNRLDVRALSTADQAIVELYQSNSGPNQRWKFIAKGTGLYELEPQHAPGKRLDVAGRSANDNSKVQTYTSNGGSNQVWKLIDLGSNIYGLEPQCAIGNRLDIGLVDGITRAVSKIANSSASQRWKLIAISAARLGADVASESVDLLSATPNPLTTETTIHFRLSAKSQQATIQLHNAQGQLVRALDVSTNTEGIVVLNRKGLATGVYLYSLVIDGDVVATKRLVVN